MLQELLTECDTRFSEIDADEQCEDCSYGDCCPHSCEDCLDYIHSPRHAPHGAPDRKYDCVHMADFYVCKYSCRYTSEMIYAFEHLAGIKHKSSLNVLSLGCGPCTDLLALEYLRENGEFTYSQLEYRGVDYSYDVWQNIHNDIAQIAPRGVNVKFYYQDVCDYIDTIDRSRWIPDLVVFQYFLSDLRKHTDAHTVTQFISAFTNYADTKMKHHSYIVLNDVNLDVAHGGGRDYFDRIESQLTNCDSRKGRFRNDTPRLGGYPRGYPYGGAYGEFDENENLFDISPWASYSPFDTCASAQMLIKRK